MRYVCCADLHIRPDKPLCRAESQEEWIETQFEKLSFILDFSKKEKASVLIAGDLCHRATGWPSWLFSRMISLFKRHPQPIICCPGQHDLPYHQIGALPESNLGVVTAARAVSCDDWEGVRVFGWGSPLSCQETGLIALTHMMILRSEKEELWPGQVKEGKASMADKILRDFPCFELIITGDNHQPFATSFEGRWLVNPGSMSRQKSNEQHEPGFYFYSNGEVERVMLPHKTENVLTQENTFLSLLSEDNPRMGDFLEEMGHAEKLNYWDAVQDYLKKKKISPQVQKRLLGE